MGLFNRRRKPDPASPAPVADRSASVVPLLAGEAWIAGTEETLSRIPDFPDAAKPFTRRLTPEVSAAYGADPEGTWEMIQRGEVGGFGGVEQLHRLAVANLVRRAAADVVVEGGAGRYRIQVPSEPDLSSSLLLVPELWRDRIDVAGDPVICAPTRIVLLVCGSEDVGAVEALRGYATAMFEQADGKPVTTALHTIAPSGLAVFG